MSGTHFPGGGARTGFSIRFSAFFTIIIFCLRHTSSKPPQVVVAFLGTLWSLGVHVIPPCRKRLPPVHGSLLGGFIAPWFEHSSPQLAASHWIFLAVLYSHSSS